MISDYFECAICGDKEDLQAAPTECVVCRDASCDACVDESGRCVPCV